MEIVITSGATTRIVMDLAEMNSYRVADGGIECLPPPVLPCCRVPHGQSRGAAHLHVMIQTRLMFL